MSGARYRAGAQRQWHRIEAPWAPLGIALESSGRGGRYIAYQLGRDQDFALVRLTPDGERFGPVRVGDLGLVRIAVAAVERNLDGRPLSDGRLEALVKAERRQTNPSEPRSFNADVRAEFLARGGIGAFMGAIVGALLGGTPGILMANTPVTSVGAHVGSIMGAAAGAFIGGYGAEDLERTSNPAAVAQIKRRVLK